MELMRSREVPQKKLHQVQPKADCGRGVTVTPEPVWTLSQVLFATGGRFHSGRTEARFRLICTDSRAVEPGDLFVALSGENFDGHDFVEQALTRGASGLLLAKAPTRELRVPVVMVDDTLKALGDLAHYRRRQMPDLTVLAVTGSSGKTTVKEMVSAILAQEYNVLKTKGNFNNLIGLPLSLLPVEHHHDFAVLEMGMNRLGEIARLAEIAEPDVACITNVQSAHLAGLSNIEGVARAKGELFAGMKAWGTLAVNIDDARVRKLARRMRHRQITFGRNPLAMVRATRLRSLGEQGMSFTLHIGSWSERIRITSLGAHNVMNSLAAAAMATAAGIKPGVIAAGLTGHRPYEKRMQVETLANGFKLINDTYNANPASVLAALTAVHNLKGRRRIVAVLGDMLELGNHSTAAHRVVGQNAVRLKFDYLLAVGEFAGEMVGAAREAGHSAEQALRFDIKEEIVDWLQQAMACNLLQPGDLILVKGSRGMRMETVVNALAGKGKG